MTKYSVSCFSPPADLSLEKGDKVRVKGRMRANRILAESVENLTKSGPICHCGGPPRAAILPKRVEKIGIVRSITVTASGKAFEMEAP